MKIVVFGPQRRVGAVAGEQVVDLNRAAAKYLRERRDAAGAAAEAEAALPARLEAFIEAGPAALDLARNALEHLASAGDERRAGEEPIAQPQQGVKLHAPWPYRSRIACAGGNFALHLARARSAHGGKEFTAEETYRQAREGNPWGFWKVPDAVAGPDDDITLPARTERFDYEGEVAIVFGKRGKDIPAERAAEYIWGVTLFNDWSIRDSGEPARLLSLNVAKNFDGSTTLGPCIVVDSLDPQNIDVEVRVNDDIRQQFNTGEMIFSFAEYIAFLSRDFTFLPGDLIASGTGAGTAMDSTRPTAEGVWPRDLYLDAGDLVEVTSPQIGTIRNRIVAKGT